MYEKHRRWRNTHIRNHLLAGTVTLFLLVIMFPYIFRYTNPMLVVSVIYVNYLAFIKAQYHFNGAAGWWLDFLSLRPTNTKEEEE